MGLYADSVAESLAWVQGLTKEECQALSPDEQRRVLELRQIIGNIHSATGDNWRTSEARGAGLLPHPRKERATWKRERHAGVPVCACRGLQVLA
jgi:hypothetical protein